MDRIKKLKIKKQDGTFSDYIPIGADAENIDTTDGESVEVKLNKKPYYFNNVADMKADTKLKAGDMAITLGYYESNDGGGAEYKIVSSSDSYYETLDNSLKAELIYHENINVKTVGASGDGIHDDTTIIQNLIDKIRADVIANNIENIKTIDFPGGKYKITSTIIVSPYVKIKTSGFTTFLSYITNGSCLHLTHSSGDQINSPTGNKQDWYRGDWINGEAGLLIKNMSENTNTSIGIEIGSKTNLNELLPTSRYIISNIRIQGFAIGILHNIYNNYLGTFFRVSVEGNSTNVQYGVTKGKLVVNSGEKMTYIDCLFASGQTGLKWLCDGMDSYFTNCSFDFLHEVFNLQYGYTQIVVNGCHIEGTSEGVIIPNSITNSKISIINSSILSTQAPICASTILDNNNSITFENNKLLYGETVNAYNSTFLFEGNSIINAQNNNRAHGLRGNMISKRTNLIAEDDFSDLTTGPITITNYKLGNRSIDYNATLLKTFEVCEDNSFDGKYLKITSPGGESGDYAFHITTDFIPVIANKTLVLNNIGYNESSFGNYIKFYDANKNKISEGEIYHYVTSKTWQILNAWVTPPHVAKVLIPAGTAFVKITYFCSFKKTQSYGCVGRLMAEYE